VVKRDYCTSCEVFVKTHKWGKKGRFSYKMGFWDSIWLLTPKRCSRCGGQTVKKDDGEGGRLKQLKPLKQVKPLDYNGDNNE